MYLQGCALGDPSLANLVHITQNAEVEHCQPNDNLEYCPPTLLKLDMLTSFHSNGSYKTHQRLFRVAATHLCHKALVKHLSVSAEDQK